MDTIKNIIANFSWSCCSLWMRNYNNLCLIKLFYSFQDFWHYNQDRKGTKTRHWGQYTEEKAGTGGNTLRTSNTRRGSKVRQIIRLDSSGIMSPRIRFFVYQTLRNSHFFLAIEFITTENTKVHYDRKRLGTTPSDFQFYFYFYFCNGRFITICFPIVFLFMVRELGGLCD